MSEMPRELHPEKIGPILPFTTGSEDKDPEKSNNKENWNDPLDGTSKNFDKEIGDYSKGLEKSLDIPAGLLKSIAWKESQYGKLMYSGTGSTGILQLTTWPFEDIACISNRKELPNRAVFDRKYASIFAKITDDTISQIPDEEVRNHMSTLVRASKNPSVSVGDIREAAMKLRNIIQRSTETRGFNHNANMLIGAIYLRAGGSQEKLPYALQSFQEAAKNMVGIEKNMKGIPISQNMVDTLIKNIESNPKLLKLAIILANYNTQNSPDGPKEGNIPHRYYYALSILLHNKMMQRQQK